MIWTNNFYRFADPSQKEILRAPLPLMIESGSGTGKVGIVLCYVQAFG